MSFVYPQHLLSLLSSLQSHLSAYATTSTTTTSTTTTTTISSHHFAPVWIVGLHYKWVLMGLCQLCLNWLVIVAIIPVTVTVWRYWFNKCSLKYKPSQWYILNQADVYLGLDGSKPRRSIQWEHQFISSRCFKCFQKIKPRTKTIGMGGRSEDPQENW